MQGICKCCEKPTDLRLGICFDCAECESVISDGTDMYDNKIEEHDGLSSYMNKLKYILKKFKVIYNTNAT